MVLDFIIFDVLSFIALISILVFVHEYGHYIVAKKCKVKVESFSIGFGKEIFGWTDKSGTRWKIAPIPFGGYVKMKGEMLELENKEYDQDKDSFHNKYLWQKALIVFAGPFFNLILPIFIFFFFAFFVGIVEISPKIKDVSKDAPSYKILQKGDEIIELDHHKVKTFSYLQHLVLTRANKDVDIKINRNGKILDLKLKIGSKVKDNIEFGFMGIVADTSKYKTYKYSLNKSFQYTVNMYIKIKDLVIYSFKRIFTGKMTRAEFGGPIKIAQMSAESLHNGIISWVFFLAMLSINLAIINLFPIPALDGGYLLMYLIQAVSRRNINHKLQKIMIQMGFFLLLALMVIVVFNDLISIIK